MTHLRDITADLGDLFPPGPVTIPMYSYARPAWILWQAVYDGMRDAGMTDEQAIDWLKSKNPRYLLDGTLGDELREIGYRIGLQQTQTPGS